MIIEKKAIDPCKYLKNLYYFNSARKGEKLVLDRLVEEGGYKILLPAYIGYSEKEGSGIYDPVVESGIEYDFYGVSKDISIDIGSLTTKLTEIKEKKQKPVVLLVHYFGYLDKRIVDIVDLCRNNGALIIEDCAHALYTDFVDHKCGEYGDFVLYSIHKMLPYKEGGILKVNNHRYTFPNRTLDYSIEEYPKIINYDLYAISKTRKRNTELWEELLLSANCSRIELVRHGCKDITPQSCPVFVHNYDRTKLYFELNEAGYGAVSLYHTMIEPIEKKYSVSVWISRHIMNLPVHQDVTEDRIREMYRMIIELLK